MSRLKPASMSHNCRHSNGHAAGLTLLELMAAVTISGLVALAALTSVRIGLQAWEKGQQAVVQLRRVTNVEDILHFQLSNHLLRPVTAVLSDSRLQMSFFFAEEHRLLFLTSYSAREHGRGGIVVADYFAEQQPDRTWKLWLEERPARNSEQLASRVVEVVRSTEGARPVLRPFEAARALLLLEGLSECRFQYRREMPAPAMWVSSWSLLAHTEMPSAVALQMRAEEARWKGLAPVPLYVRMRIAGVTR